jgi:FKBP-type peptidyl-prolyl cis-trans isomerase FkpA
MKNAELRMQSGKLFLRLADCLLFRVLSAGLVMSLLLASCDPEPKKQPVVIDSKKLKENIVNVNKPAVVMENDEINAWIKSHGYAMKTTGTGLRYYIFRENKKGKQVALKDEVKVKYKVSLLDGTLCYSSDQKGPRTFLVGADQIESGLHEGIQLMREGEKAIFVLPSHLAFGLVGDRDKIPPKTAVVYEIEVMEVK